MDVTTSHEIYVIDNISSIVFVPLGGPLFGSRPDILKALKFRPDKLTRSRRNGSQAA